MPEGYSGPQTLSCLARLHAPQLMPIKREKCPRDLFPAIVLPVWAGFWDVHCSQRCSWPSLPSLPTKTNGSGKPSEFYSEALEIIQHCQKKGFADRQNPIGKPRWIYDLGWKPIWTLILHESDPSPEPGKTSWFWLIFHTQLLSTSVHIWAEDSPVVLCKPKPQDHANRYSCALSLLLDVS